MAVFLEIIPVTYFRLERNRFDFHENTIKYIIANYIKDLE